MAYHPPDITLHYPYLRRMSWAQITAAAEDAEIHHDYARALILWQHAYHAGKRKLIAVCSHQTRIGNLDAHLI